MQKKRPTTSWKKQKQQQKKQTTILKKQKQNQKRQKKAKKKQTTSWKKQKQKQKKANDHFEKAKTKPTTNQKKAKKNETKAKKANAETTSPTTSQALFRNKKQTKCRKKQKTMTKQHKKINTKTKGYKRISKQHLWGSFAKAPNPFIDGIFRKIINLPYFWGTSISGKPQTNGGRNGQDLSPQRATASDPHGVGAKDHGGCPQPSEDGGNDREDRGFRLLKGDIYIGGSINVGTPKWLVYRENPIKMDDD